VDADACGSSIHETYSTDLLITSGGTPPIYSYSTCGGDVSAWKDTLVADALKNNVLKVAFPVDVHPEHYMVHKGTEDRICTNADECQVLDDSALYDMRGLWVEYVQERSAKQTSGSAGFASLARPI
jgi:hypothetical protein